jgi:exopolysaccharide biosynthesis polyprenyl glycosylphosphotransferase
MTTLPAEEELRLVPRPAPQPVRVANWCRAYALTLAGLDALAMFVAVVLARLVRFGTIHSAPRATGGLGFSALVLVAMVGWVLALALKGAYQRRSLGSGSEEYRRVVDATVLFLAAVAVIAFVFDVHIVRGFVALVIPLAGVLSVLERYALRQRLHRMRSHGRFTRQVLVVGSSADCIDLIRCMRRSPYAGLTAVAVCTPGGLEALPVDGEEIPVVAGPEEVLEAVIASRADTVAIADTTTLSNGKLRRLAWGLEGTGVALMVTPAVTDLAGPRISVRPVSDLPLLHVEEPELKGIRRLGKEALDRVSAAIGLLVLSPFLLVMCVIVRLTSPGPAIFRQVRVGVGGRHYVMYKIRTMVEGAEAILPELAHLNEHDGVLFKMRHDPRITRVGRFLRRWSLDELPQLWNVLRGDMSIVGPRPPLPTEVERYSRSVRRRLLVKPGLTGLWQVSGRVGLPWEEAVRLDLYYVENWSLSMDAMIIARTLSAVFHGQGAC